MVDATNKEKYSSINCIAIAKRASLEVVDLPSPYFAIFIIGHVRYQYSNVAPRLSGQTSKFDVVFFVSKSLLGIESQKKLKNCNFDAKAAEPC